MRHTTANKAINKPEDMKGLKLRVPDAPLYIMYPRIAGANATPIAFAEVYLALQNKTVDAQENPLPTILAKKFYEVQTHVNLTGHITEMLIAIVGGHVWNKLSDADKKTFEAVFQEAAEKSNAEIVASEKRWSTEFGTKYGKTVVKSDREAFKKVFTPFLTAKDVPWDKALYDRVQAIKVNGEETGLAKHPVVRPPGHLRLHLPQLDRRTAACRRTSSTAARSSASATRGRSSRRATRTSACSPST